MAESLKKAFELFQIIMGNGTGCCSGRFAGAAAILFMISRTKAKAELALDIDATSSDMITYIRGDLCERTAF